MLARRSVRFAVPDVLTRASANQIFRPLESIAETQPQLQPAALSLSAMISQYFTRRIMNDETLSVGHERQRSSSFALKINR